MINGFKTKMIIHKSLGDKLKQLRLKKELDLNQAQEATQIRLRYLSAFEDNSFACLPGEVYAVGYLKRYLEYLDTPTDQQTEYIKDFKKEYRAWKLINQTTLNPGSPKEKSRLVVTPKLLVIAGSIFSVLIVFSYIFIQVRHLTAPPQLSILPLHSHKVVSDNINLSGETDPGANIVINNEPINQDQYGNFKQSIALENGINIIHIVATNRFNKKNKQTLTIVKVKKGDSNGIQKNS